MAALLLRPDSGCPKLVAAMRDRMKKVHARPGEKKRRGVTISAAHNTPEGKAKLAARRRRGESLEVWKQRIAQQSTRFTVDTIIKAVAGFFSLKATDLTSAVLRKSMAIPRAFAMYLARVHTKDTYPNLARVFAGKYTTVFSAVQKIADRICDDVDLRAQITAIEQQFVHGAS